MAKITILGKPGKTKPQEIGKKGRQARMFEKSRKMTALWEKAVVKPSAVDTAINLAHRDKKLIDIANYHCVKGKATTNTVRAKQKRQMGCRELVRT
ncbi:hypothetical protein BKG95_03685 [Rodentibacter pneumotropicus]|nr:hypothetical protein [Rodentibacter pneumotropicus]NBH76304.1 hypothetical protein [Rodentibacter pneumotropicus]OOF68512.1 hypothetical protein BKG95_03685 [Rodentibacter pneumotropicus]THA07265.1 hypothetical protein D3M73_02595 [Rodentibacter pneumotropicus]THA09364.1 hypothetical protein D3M81_11390 [Rodentibacter pneumotropicus]